MMDNLTRAIIKSKVMPEDKKYVDEAITNIIKRDASIFERMYKKREYDIDEKMLFTDIDSVIKFLNSLKKDGYTNIEQKWSGYEDNYFVATKIEKETDEEMYERFCHEIEEEIEEIEKKLEIKEKKKEEMNVLRNKMRKLQAEINEL